MTRIPFHRPARLAYPEPPRDRIAVPTPPPQTRPQTSSVWLTMMLPLLSTLAMAGYLISYGRPLLIVLGIGFVVLSLVATLGMRWQMRHAAEATQRRQRDRYLELLDEVRSSARTLAAVTRRSAVIHQPSPQRLLALVGAGRRTWERRPGDPDFLRIRLGAGNGPLGGGVELSGRMDPMAEYDRSLMGEAEALIADHRTVGEQPAWLDLARCGVVSLVGSERVTRALARSLVLQIAALHAPEDVTIAVHTGGADGWEWAKWLPHTHEPGAAASEAGVTSLVAEDLERLADYLERERDRAREETRNRRGYGPATGVARRLVLVLDGYRPDEPWVRTPILESLWADAGPELGITVVCLTGSRAAEPGRVDGRATVGDDGALELSGPTADRYAVVEAARADLSPERLCEAIARRLAPLRLTEDREPVLSRITTLPEMLGVTDVGQLDPHRGRVLPSDPDMLRVPLGVDGDGQPVLLDLKESAQRGMGPHGLVVGATGSGKSELLRTLVTGLAAKHSPDLLSFVLVDFKGGATFAGVTQLPHVSGLITNLADDLAMVDRVRAALQGEQQRRQRVLRDAGNVDSVREYQMRQAAGGTDVNGQPLEPLPYLVIIVDEFGELLSGRPDFIDLFVQIGRVGRSLGMHLLLATQRLEESRLRGLQSHLSYRLCLRTFSAAESRAVIGTPDAYHLPPVPGSAYLKVDETIYTRFRVAHVSGPYLGARDPDDERNGPVRLVPYTLRPAATALTEQEAHPPVVTDLNTRTELQVAVDRLASIDQPVHQVWLPPLPAVITLGSLLGPLSEHPERGLTAELWQWPGGLKFPIAVVDLPASQQQEPMVVDLSGKDGNVAVVGAPQSGKTVLLRSLLLSAMLTGTPDEIQASIIDFGGGGLLPLASAPHVTGAASRLEPARARRLLAEAMRLVTEREELFRAEGIGSVAEFRRRRDARNLPPGTRAADLFVVIDNWPAVRAELDDADALVVEFAARGLGVGVHLVLSANRWIEIRANLRDSIGGRIELRLNDPYESEISRAISRQLTGAVPGRGAIAPGVFFQAALPTVDERAGTDVVDELSETQAKLVARIAGAWRGASAPAVRMLPDRLTVAELAQRGGRVAGAVGLDEVDLATVAVDLGRDQPHFLVFGDSGSGKSQFLRTWMRAVADSVSEDQARFMVVDYRRSLLGAVPDGHVGAYAGDPHAAEVYARQLAERLAERRPPSNISASELRTRSWWQGPELYLVVDDLDMLTSGAGGPLAPLVPFLVQSRELGFHVVAAHRSAGASRALMSGSMLGRVAELGADGLVLSGEPREGALLGGVRPAPQPPGRGILVRRGRPPVLIQVAIDPEDELVSF
ncbi:S-DNA-T family DNA segregation ATPase FtsK/SpoIIIE [Micromonospora pisi]|uniref:S-DNA-T family DNA segregation ATPase FtsK/SpoIIIE n=1 Tax=Micromonospora pisi TaxID=589240 RepID=A0A495JL89_9ACTN|nr:type VII secretion protein EccCa [Micromonospora pisi]RKR89415.1 S-DNA-T family DNA segregation ATPase FtsK/SpoIIIE [Micromonospora pisi]